MSFRDKSFDISIDKGTYDALAVIWFTYLIVRSRVEGGAAELGVRDGAGFAQGSDNSIFRHA